MVNKVTLMGRIGKIHPSDKVANASIVTTESYKDKDSGEWQNIDSWHNITIFSKAGERFKENIKVGNLVYLEGKLKTEEHDGKYYTKVIVSYYRKVVSNSGSGENSSSSPDPASNSQPEPEPAGVAASSTSDDDDLPF